MTEEELADDLIRYYSAYLSGEAQPSLDKETAWDRVSELIDADPDRAWRIVLAAIERGPVEIAHFIGASQLQDLIADLGESLVDRIENAARRQRKMAIALGAVDLGPWTPPRVVDRLRAIAPEIRYERPE